MDSYTNEELRDCAKRELGLRERVYPRRVADGKMTQSFADQETGKMRAILDILEERCAAGRLI